MRLTSHSAEHGGSCDRVGNYTIALKAGPSHHGDMDKATVKRLLGIAPPSTYLLEEEAYARLAAKGFAPDAIIDVGAWEGNWTRLARTQFGEIPSLMVEPQAAKRPFLEAVCSDFPLARYVSTVLSASAGETVTFYEMLSGSSFLQERSNAPRTETKLTTRTLDEVAADLPGSSLFLKIDVQGAELLVLAGGQDTLARSEVVQLEVALLPYNEGAPTFLEVLFYMDERGFVPFDFSGESRPNGHLVQIDMIFVRRESPLRPKTISF